MKSYEDLYAWQSAMELVEEIYSVTRYFPQSEQYGLSSQLKRASSSIAANIAEGFGRYTFADKANRYVIARGECTEVEAYLKIAVRVRLCTEEQTRNAMLRTKTTGRLLSGLIQSSRKLHSI